MGKHQHKAKDHQERAARRFTRIREAYEVLSEEASKMQYDAMLILQLPPNRDSANGGATNGVEAKSTEPERLSRRIPSGDDVGGAGMPYVGAGPSSSVSGATPGTLRRSGDPTRSSRRPPDHCPADVLREQ